MRHAAMDHYRTTAAVGGAEAAPPEKLVALLYAGLIERIGRARAAIHAGDVPLKIGALASAQAIVEHLRISLDFAAGGEIARNLDALYDYVSRRLLQANRHDDVAILDEVLGLLRGLSEAWETATTRH